MNLVSPRDMYDAACEHMLDGFDPITDEDWQLVVNFMAANIHEDSALPAMKLLKAIFDIPLSDEEIQIIVEFQTREKIGRRN
jgi:hypothetical protein